MVQARCMGKMKEWGKNTYGTYILSLNVFTGLVINIYMISSSALNVKNGIPFV